MSDPVVNARLEAQPGSREDTESRMRCNRCEGDGSVRKQPCQAGGKTYASHDYELIRAVRDAG